MVAGWPHHHPLLSLSLVGTSIRSENLTMEAHSATEVLGREAGPVVRVEACYLYSDTLLLLITTYNNLFTYIKCYLLVHEKAALCLLALALKLYICYHH